MTKPRKRHLPAAVEKEIVAGLQKKYTDRTVEVYRINLDVFSQYLELSEKEITKATFDDIIEFLDNLKVKGLSNQTRNQYLAALRFYFNDLKEKAFPFENYSIPRKYVGENPVHIPEEELIQIIAAAESFRDRVLICLTYGSGLELGEVRELKPTDVNLNNRTLKIRTRRSTFTTVIAENLIEDLREYIKEYKPSKYLFEGQKSGTKLSENGVRWVFNRALKRTGIVKHYKFKNLKYSFVKHLQHRGYSLLSILKLAGNSSEATAYKYLQMDKSNEMLRVSPLDLIMKPHTKAINSIRLSKKVLQLSNEDEKEYLLEAIQCFETNALRAGIVLTWIAAIRNLQNKLLKHHSLHSINVAIQKHVRDPKPIRSIADFSYILEGVQLKAACDLGEIDKNEKIVLEGCLDLRNNCGHPGKYRPEEFKALAFLEDLLTIIFDKE
jgi:site-specific recombinase XerD